MIGTARREAMPSSGTRSARALALIPDESIGDGTMGIPAVTIHAMSMANMMATTNHAIDIGCNERVDWRSRGEKLEILYGNFHSAKRCYTGADITELRGRHGQ